MYLHFEWQFLFSLHWSLYDEYQLNCDLPINRLLYLYIKKLFVISSFDHYQTSPNKMHSNKEILQFMWSFVHCTWNSTKKNWFDLNLLTKFCVCISVSRLPIYLRLCLQAIWTIFYALQMFTQPWDFVTVSYIFFFWNAF